MSSAPRLGPRDYDAALGLVSEAASSYGDRPFEAPTIQGLLGLIPAERAGYFEYGGGGIVFGEVNTFLVDMPSQPECEDMWASSVVRENILSWPLRDCTSPEPERRPPVMLSDFLSSRALRRNTWYCEIMRPSNIEHELKVWLPSGPGTTRGFFFVRHRGRRDFDERDRSMLAVLMPHLARIRERWERRRRPSSLTAREAEVLEFVAQGLTNGEIAARLVISVTTVRTHLENIFEKLDVHTRTAAVARLRVLDAQS